MFNSLTRSLSLLMVLTIVAPVCASATPVSHNETRALNIHGLDFIGLDTWTQILAKGKNEGLAVQDLHLPLQKILGSANNEQQVFARMRGLLQTARIASVADYRDVALMLLEARQSLRQRSDLSMKTRQDTLFLLQLMAEESLYIGAKKFVDFPKEISFQGKVSSAGQTSKLRQFEVQTGDVVLSKSTGFGSSSFIALTMDHPHIYSHSTPVYLGKQGELLSPEAEIEDGVKLRSMQKDYVEGSKTRMYIYRYQGNEPGVKEKVIAGMENLVADMYSRTGGEPFDKAAFLYDFSMTPGNAAERGLFCSSVAYEAYTRGGLENSANPYDKSLWSPISKGREVLLNALNMNTDRVPAPGDMELNKNFHLVGARVDVSKLAQDRVEMAIIDAFLAEIEANKETMARLAISLNVISSKPIDKEGLSKLAKAGMLPKELAEKVALIEKVPDSINLKQMAFFAFLNEVMTPKVRVAILAQVSDLEKQGKIVGPVELRKMARAHGNSMQAEIAKFEQKVSAITGVGMCSKVLL